MRNGIPKRREWDTEYEERDTENGILNMRNGIPKRREWDTEYEERDTET